MCRIPDTIEDSQLSVSQKNTLLHTYQVTIKNGLDGSLFLSKLEDTDYPHSDDWDLVEQTDEVLELFHTLNPEIQAIIQHWVVEMTIGMRRYVTRDTTTNGVIIKSQDDLETYCYYVAGTIGNMIGELLDVTYDNYQFTDSLRTHATRYGLFLQRINVSKDVYDDYTEEKTIYLPKTKLKEYGLTDPQNFLKNKNAIEQTVRTVLDRTKSYENSAQKFLESVQSTVSENYQGWAIPYGLAIETRDEVYQSLADVPTETPVKIDRTTVLDVVQKTSQTTSF